MTSSMITAQEPKAKAKKSDEDSSRVREFLALAKDRFKAAEEAESKTRADSLDDLKFRVGDQWPDDIKSQRNLDSRPCLTMNRLPQFVRQVTNEQRQQRPAIQINPRGSGSDPETAEIIQGIVRHIEVNSDAEIAYDTAFEQMVTGGIGWFRILTDYASDESFDQEILVKPIKNPFCVYDDPAAVELDRSDARFRFVVADLSRDEYKSRYPKSLMASAVDFQSVGDVPAGWAGKDSIRVAEYWYVEDEEKTIYQLADGTISDEVPEGQTPTNQRSKTVRKVNCATINAVEILEESDWAGKWIPVIPVVGDDLDVNGERHISGLLRHMKDPQRQYNFMCSAATEAIALAPKAPFIIAAGQVEGHEAIWTTANTKNWAYLPYESMDVNGKPMPAPHRESAEPPIQAMMLMVRQADNDLKATSGIYDAALGQAGPDQSGRAILARQKQTDVATLNFSDNLARTMRHAGRIIIDLIPHIYDSPRVQRIINPDQSVKHVGVYNSKASGMQDPAAVEAMLQGEDIKKIYDIGLGQYDVTVSVGPSYQSKRQESAASMLAMAQANPTIMQVAPDLVIRSMDWPGADEIADRYKKMLPAQLQDDPEGEQQPVPPQAQAKMQQMQQQGQQMHAYAQQLEGKLKEAQQKEQGKVIENEYRMSIEKLKIEASVAIAEIGSKSQEASMRARLELDVWKQIHGSAHDIAMQASQPQPTDPTQDPSQAQGGQPQQPAQQAQPAQQPQPVQQ